MLPAALDALCGRFFSANKVVQLKEQAAALSIPALSADTGPSGYASSKHSAEEMDALSNQAAAMGAT